MASGDNQGPAGNGGGQGGFPGGWALVTVDAEALAATFASHDELARSAERYMNAATREIDLLRRINTQLVVEVTSLAQRVAELTSRREEGPAAPGEGGKPL